MKFLEGFSLLSFVVFFFLHNKISNLMGASFAMGLIIIYSFYSGWYKITNEGYDYFYPKNLEPIYFYLISTVLGVISSFFTVMGIILIFLIALQVFLYLVRKEKIEFPQSIENFQIIKLAKNKIDQISLFSFVFLALYISLLFSLQFDFLQLFSIIPSFFVPFSSYFCFILVNEKRIFKIVNLYISKLISQPLEKLKSKIN